MYARHMKNSSDHDSYRATAAASIARKLVDRIEDGELRVGSILPSEIELATEFGVSRPSVREALSALQFAGYVEPRRGRGTLVLAASPVPGHATNVPVAGSFAEVVDILEARLVVEPQTVALAALDPDLTALDEAAVLLQGMEVAVADVKLAADTDHRWHMAVAKICANHDLRDYLIYLLRRASGACWRSSQAAAWREGSQQPHLWACQHSALLDAIAKGDHESAAAIAREHLLSAIDNAAGSPDMPPSLQRRLRQIRLRHTTPAGPQS